MFKKDLEKIAHDFFKYFDPEAQIEVTENIASDATAGDPTSEDRRGWWVKVTSPSSGHLIGKMGETLAEIQNLIRLMASQKSGEFMSITVDVDGYKEKRENELAELAIAMAENVKTSGYPQEMKPTSAYNRRLVHMALDNFPDVEAVSIGEGELRRIEIKPKE